MSNDGRIKAEGVKCVLLDIEGTVCPISFVKETLFPYALKALPEVLATKWDSPDFIPFRDAFPAEHRATPEALQAHVEDLTARDIKIAYLKDLQGYLWERGFKEGAYVTELFPEVVGVLKKWRKVKGLDLAIYSSGSVFAQKLLFGHVKGAEGPVDLTEWFDGKFYDTLNAGPKLEAASYVKIAEGLKLQPDQILFLSDNDKEVEAAYNIGMQVVLVDRPGNAPLSELIRAAYEVVTSLSQLKVTSKPAGSVLKSADGPDSSADELPAEETKA